MKILHVAGYNRQESGLENVISANSSIPMLEIDVIDGKKSVRAKNRCNASRLETADRARDLDIKITLEAVRANLRANLRWFRSRRVVRSKRKFTRKFT
jgi:hypothetical protein